MAHPKFSVGIDLGTSNSVLAYAPLSGDGAPEALAIPQWETPTTEVDAPILPSFLYRPEDAVAAGLRGRGHAGDWIVGRLAQRKAGEAPGRVAHSAKSWLCHHAADRSARFLPWGSDDLPPDEKISPVTASALILAHLRAAWNRRFAGQGADYAFDAQDVTIAVPASFDAAAQRLTLAAAQEAGFPDQVRLLEEPQAAFYWWLDQQAGGGDAARLLDGAADSPRHVLVIDIGGGTSDFSLFELTPRDGARDPEIKRIAVSDHILLGGDNIDLAIAHLFEPRFAGGGTTAAAGQGGLSARQWDHLIAQCRSLKERVLTGEGAPDDVFTASIPGRGAGLFAGAASAQATRADIERLLLEGFFPDCWSTEKPKRALGAVKEWGLPYAFDSAITRHLAAFLNGRPRVDAVLFNGGSVKPEQVRQRLREQIGKWQEGPAPQELHSAELDLAVARGAASAGRRLRRGVKRIESGAARAVFLEVHRRHADGAAGAKTRSLVCVLPHGAPPETTYESSNLDLRLRLNRPIRFQVYTSTRQEATKAGDVVELTPDDFEALPSLETVATLERASTADAASTVPVALNARLNELGLLQVSCRSLAPRIRQSWPLEFNLRPDERGPAAPAGGRPASAAPQQIGVAAESLAHAREFIAAFAEPAKKGQKITGQRLFDALERLLGKLKGEWNGILLRELWAGLADVESGRALSVEHEEAWLILAGFLLRPGFGVTMDERRIDDLWRIVRGGLRFPGKRIKLQEYILWRRVAGGLDRERQEALLAAEEEKLRLLKAAPPELIRMAGAFERIGQESKARLIELFLDAVVKFASEQKHCAPYLAALGLLLNRTPFHAGPETIVPPDLVERAYDALRRLDWGSAPFEEAQTLFLRAARAIDDPRLNPSRSLREQIANKLEKCGVAPLKAGRLRHVVPVEQAERLALFGEALPPGLILGGEAD